MMLRVTAALLASLAIAAALGAAEPPTLKKRIAVFEFQDKTDGSVAWWRGGQNIGQGMSDMLLTALVKSGQYTVIEREKLAQVMQEQSLGASGGVTEQTAASIGKLLGVEIAVFGAVTQFGYSEEEKGGRVPIRGPMGRFGGGGANISIKTAEAKVTIDVRLVNTSTGEILDAETVTGSEIEKGVSVSNARVRFTNEKEFDESMAGKAARKSVVAIVAKVTEKMKKVPWSGKIVKVEGASVVINAGSSTGLRLGDTLVVYAKGEDLIDPDTGLKLGSEETRVGKVKILADMAEGKASKCELIEGQAGQRGDIVRYAQ
jgi:curli biogenesis system outer membrane secretion channel CsgG